MESYMYPYPAPFTLMQPPDGEYPDHGDGFGQYYDLNPLNEDRDDKRCSRSKQRKDRKALKRSRSGSRTSSKAQSRSRTRSRTQSSSRTRTITHTCSTSGSRRELNLKDPGFLDAFRVLYLTPSKQSKSTTKYLTTKKRLDRVNEILKEDRLGSKRWYFYPKSQNQMDVPNEVPGTRDNCDQRIKVDADFLKKYKRNKKVNDDAPIAKLKRWELILYKKLGFIQAA